MSANKIGRNELCPCGSGKKFKRCCLAKDERERREQAAEARQNTDVWFPTADDLQLPDVPDALRPEARRVLGSALPLMFGRGIAVRLHECWRVAQALTVEVAGELRYVEGVWECDCNRERSHPHGWNSFQGHIIDLLAEFHRSPGDNHAWLHEPLKSYGFDEVIAFGSRYHLSNCSIARCHWLDSGGRKTLPRPDASYADNESWDYVDRIVFKDARERLLARINSTTHGAAAA